MAVVSLVAGIIGWVMFPLISSVIAVITGHMAKNEIRSSGGRIGGDGLATAGLILGYSSLVIWGIGLCCVVILFVLPLFGMVLIDPSIYQ